MSSDDFWGCVRGIAVMMAVALSYKIGCFVTASRYEGAESVGTVRVVSDTVMVYQPPVVDTVYAEVPAAVDTAEVVAAYYSRVVQADTVRLMEFGSVVLVDTVYMNAVSSRSVSYDLRMPTMRVSSRKWSVGVGTVIGRDMAAVYASVRRGRWSVMGGYDVESRSPMVGAQYNFGL